MNAIEVSNLTVSYGALLAVNGISFSVRQGEIYGMIGPNGAGKTTTLECLEGLRKPKGGTIAFSGIDSIGSSSFYTHVGVQLQETKFQDAIKVKELVALYSSFYPSPADTKELLSRFQLAEKSNAFVKTLSGGQRQKLAILLALIGNPKVLILDEISAGLDPYARVQIWDTIHELNQSGMTILLTTHFMEEAEYLCDRVCMLVNGKIKAGGTLTEMVSQADLKIQITAKAPPEELAKLDPSQVPDGIEMEVLPTCIHLFLTDTRCISLGMAWLCSQIQVTDLDLIKPKLEDVFLKLTGAELEAKQ
jgi:ABC-2 type transport system ATP-binding protein